MIAKVLVEPFATRAEVLEAETFAIQTEHPIFNKIHNDRNPLKELARLSEKEPPPQPPIIIMTLPWEEGGMTIQQFCELERISELTYHKMHNAGRAPREMRRGANVRISHQERLRWQKEMEKPTEAQREIDEKLRERAYRASAAKSARLAGVSHEGSLSSAL
jgi:hypothetical protein